jgi:hypothetical protein
MHRFLRSAPLNRAVFPDSPPSERSGLPLSKGFVLTLIDTAASEYCTPEVLKFIEQVDPEAWYEGQVLETILNQFEEQDPNLPYDIGKNIYYTLRSQFVAMGLKTPNDVITTLPGLWMHVTRGDSGEWRTALTGPQQARLELEQPYNCRFEEGALAGALEAFDAIDVAIDHSQCMRDGAPYCVLNVRWRE